MEQLKKSRKSASAQLTSAKKALDTWDVENANQEQSLKVRIEKLQPIYDKFEKAQSELEETCDETDMQQHLDERERFEEKFILVKAGFLGLLDKHQVTNPKPGAGTSQVKLPKIELPVFSGKYTEWTSFNDLFTTLVHNNKNISEVEKLQYLKNALKGEPAQLLQSIQITADNYSS